MDKIMALYLGAVDLIPACISQINHSDQWSDVFMSKLVRKQDNVEMKFLYVGRYFSQLSVLAH